MIKYILGIAALSLLFFSCTNDENFDSGGLINSDVKIITIDTFTVNMSTFKYDSIVNSGLSRMMIGRYTDPYFGEVKSSAFIEMLPESYYISADAVFDSIVLNLKYDGYMYNDTLQYKTIQVRQLSKELRLKNGEEDFYNTSSIPVFDEVLGEKTFLPRISNDSLTIRLNDALGQQFLQRIQGNQINDSEEFIDFFKGLKLSPGEGEDASIIGFDPTSCYMRIYYSIPGITDVNSETFDLKYNSSSKKFFNNIETNYTGTALDGIGGQENEFTSASTNNLTYIQSGAGVLTKIAFPSFRDLKYVNNNYGTIFKAELKIKLDKSYYDKNLYFSDSLYVITLDQNNDIIEYTSTGYIDRGNSELNEVYIVAPVKEFLEKTLTDNLYLNYSIALLPFDYTGTNERIILNGEENEDNKSKLELTYVTYN